MYLYTFTLVVPDDIRRRQCSQQCHGQTEAEIIRPVPLDVRQPLVHLDPFERQKQTRHLKQRSHTLKLGSVQTDES